MTRIERLVVHHSASDLITKAEDIELWHLARGFSGIGYHFVIEQDGGRRVGRPFPSVGAHVKGANHDSIGVCLVGDNTRPEAQWTRLQRASLRELVQAVRVLLPDIKVCGHRDLAATECPGLDLNAIL